MPEERGFQQVRRHRAGIHRNKRPVAPRRIQVDGFGDQLFAGSAFALQKYGGAAGRHLRHQVKNLQHGLAFAHDVFKVVALLEGALELNVFLFRAMAGDSGANVRQQFLVVPRLLDEVRGAGLHRLHRIFHRAVSGDHDDGQLRVVNVKLRQEIDAIAVGQSQVEQDQVVGPVSDPRQTLVGGGGRLHVVAFHLQQSLQRLADGGFVVNDQHGTRGRSFRPGCVAASWPVQTLTAFLVSGKSR